MLDNSKKMYGWVRSIRGDPCVRTVEIYYDGTVTILENVTANDISVGDFIECIDGTINIVNKRKNVYGDGNSYPNPFMDLRNKKYEFMRIKSDIVKYSLEFFCNNNFLYVETPCLAKSIGEYTEEEFKVTSSLFDGEYYTLNQSPQIFKQLLMAGGISQYFQIARNFRAEVGGPTHLQEFTQIDVEMSMTTQDDILDIIERYVQFLYKKILNVDLTIPFPRLDYVGLCERFHVNDPAEALADSRNRQIVRTYKTGEWDFAWIVNFPYAAKDSKGEFVPVHHIMSRPQNYSDAWNKDLDKIICSGYDLMINGIEIAGGDLRIYDYNQQKVLLERLKCSDEQIKGMYEPLLKGLAEAMPPHGGFAFGLERLAMILAETEEISDVVAFPKSIYCRDDFFGAPTKFV